MINKSFLGPLISSTLLIGLTFVLSILPQGHSESDKSALSKNSNESIDTGCIDHHRTLDKKQRGAHVFGIEDTSYFQNLSQSNIEWVTMVSWGNQEDYDSPIMTHHNDDSVYLKQYNAHWVKRIKIVREAGFKVFLKPHIWVNDPSVGKWRSDIFPTNEENWVSWKESYRNFILRYAKIAELAGAEMFCVGMELSRLSVEKPCYWEDLITEVRGIYSGKITYAANWYKEFEEVSFWDDLDFIGIQAYFPLVDNNYPTVVELSQGWKPHLNGLESIHEKYNRQVLFTEMGYKSTADSAIKPWEWIENSSTQKISFSPETQANCYEAFFASVWNKEWFAGVHIWQLRTDFKKNGKINLDFTPQGKLAEEVIAKGFE